mmetsp:Transcript_978/g.2746  ORF Transcript_978/g.2746 Transcript_978/m.2746 type:complete len:889 (+) Transcript_978:128-2794(+)
MDSNSERSPTEVSADVNSPIPSKRAVAVVTDTPRKSPRREKDLVSHAAARRLLYDEEESSKKKARVATPNDSESVENKLNGWTASQNRYLLETIAGWQRERLDWSLIAEYLPDRSPRAAKKYWERAADKYTNMLAQRYHVNPNTINLLSRQWVEQLQLHAIRLDPNINKTELFDVLNEDEAPRPNWGNKSPGHLKPAPQSHTVQDEQTVVSLSTRKSTYSSKSRTSRRGRRSSSGRRSRSKTKRAKESVGEILRSGQRIVTIKVEKIEESEKRSPLPQSLDRRDHDELSYSSSEGQNRQPIDGSERDFGINEDGADEASTIGQSETGAVEEGIRSETSNNDKQHSRSDGSGLRNLMTERDKKGLSDFVVIIMENVLPCQAAKVLTDATDSTVEGGSVGFVCRHCKGQGGVDCRYFPPSAEKVADLCNIYLKHCSKCRDVPNHIKDAIEASFEREKNSTLSSGPREQYFARVWDRLNRRAKQRAPDSSNGAVDQEMEKDSPASSVDDGTATGAKPKLTGLGKEPSKRRIASLRKTPPPAENQEEEPIERRRGRPRKARPKPQDKVLRPTTTSVLEAVGIGSTVARSNDTSVVTTETKTSGVATRAMVTRSGRPEQLGLHGQNELLPIFEEGDKLILSDYVVTVMEQVVACWADDEDTKRNVKPPLKKGFPGLLCTHCVGKSRATREGKYFFTSQESLLQAPEVFNEHLVSCRSTPNEVNEAIGRCYKKQKDQMKHLEKEDEIDYFTRLWHRLQSMILTEGEKIEVPESGDDDEAESDKETRSSGSESEEGSGDAEEEEEEGEREDSDDEEVKEEVEVEEDDKEESSKDASETKESEIYENGPAEEEEGKSRARPILRRAPRKKVAPRQRIANLEAVRKSARKVKKRRFY